MPLPVKTPAASPGAGAGAADRRRGGDRDPASRSSAGRRGRRRSRDTLPAARARRARARRSPTRVRSSLVASAPARPAERHAHALVDALAAELQLAADRHLDAGLAGRATSAGTQRIRVSSGGLFARLRSACAGSEQRARLQPRVRSAERRFTTRLPTGYAGRKFRCRRLRFCANAHGAGIAWSARRAWVPPCWRRPSRACSSSSCATGAGVAGAGYFQIAPPTTVPERRADGRSRRSPTCRRSSSRAVEPGGPRTLLVLGSDRRAKTSKDAKLSASRAAALGHDRARPPRSEAQPDRRALAPARPRGDDPRATPTTRRSTRPTTRAARALTLDTVKHLFETATGETFHDQQRHRRQLQRLPAGGQLRQAASTSTSTATTTTPRAPGSRRSTSRPGYQRLVGSDALAYVRYRHTDSDIFRNARQQDFLRQAASQPAVRQAQEPRRGRATSSASMRSYFRFDKKFLAPQEPRRACSRPRSTSRSTTRRSTRSRSHGDHRVRGPDGGHAAVHLQRRARRRPTTQFMTGEGDAQPEARDEGHRRLQEGGARRRRSAAWRTRAALGEDMAVLAAPRLKKLPFYFPGTSRPARATSTTRRASTRCATSRASCHRAYRIVISIGAPGEY